MKSSIQRFNCFPGENLKHHRLRPVVLFILSWARESEGFPVIREGTEISGTEIFPIPGRIPPGVEKIFSMKREDCPNG